MRISKDVAIFLLKHHCLIPGNAGIRVKGFGIAAWEAGDEDDEGNPLPAPDELFAEIWEEDDYESILNDPEYTDIQIWAK